MSNLKKQQQHSQVAPRDQQKQFSGLKSGKYGAIDMEPVSYSQVMSESNVEENESHIAQSLNRLNEPE